MAFPNPRFLLKRVFCFIKNIFHLVLFIMKLTKRFFNQRPTYSGVKSFFTTSGRNKKGPHGLRNQGATCYLNSVLQVLFMTMESLEKKDKHLLNETERVLRDLFDKLKTEECKTESITLHLQIDNVYEQRDAAQYLKLLLNLMSENVSKPFCGMSKDLTECSECKQIIEVPSKFFLLPLPLSDSSSVSEGLEKMSERKRVPGYYCNNCKRKTQATTSCEITESPQILVLLVKRFVTDIYGRYYKSDTELELSDSVEIKTGEETHSYSLCGVVDHLGGLSGGHYTATLQSEDGHWYCFNDTSVTLFENKSTKSLTAYLLIYKRKIGTKEDQNSVMNLQQPAASWFRWCTNAASSYFKKNGNKPQGGYTMTESNGYEELRRLNQGETEGLNWDLNQEKNRKLNEKEENPDEKWNVRHNKKQRENQETKREENKEEAENQEEKKMNKSGRETGNKPRRKRGNKSRRKRGNKSRRKRGN